MTNKVATKVVKMEKIQEYNIFGRQIVYVVAANIATLLLAIIQLPILTKDLGTSQYGFWSLLTMIISLLTPFAMLSFNSSIMRFLTVEKDADKIREDFLSACSLVMLTGFIFSLLFFSLSGFLATSVLKDSSLSLYFRLGSVLILLNSIFPVILAFFRLRGKVGIYNLLNIGLSALQLALIILFILLGYRLKGVIEAVILSAAAMDIIGATIIFKQIGFRLPRFSNMKMYLKWGLPLTPNYAIQWIINQSDTYIINYFSGLSSAGIYNAAGNIGAYASFLSTPVAVILYPIISKTYDEGKYDECRNYFKYSFKYLIMFSIPAAFGLSVLAKPILLIITTSEFVSGASVVALSAFAALLSCLYQIGIFVFHLVGKTQIVLVLMTIAAVLNVILNIILVPHMGIIGAGVGSLITYTVLGVLTLVVSRRYLKFDLSLSFIIRSVLASGLMALCIWLIRPQSAFMVFVSFIVGIITYFGALILARGFSKIELVFFATFIRNIFNGIFAARN